MGPTRQGNDMWLPGECPRLPESWAKSVPFSVWLLIPPVSSSQEDNDAPSEPGIAGVGREGRAQDQLNGCLVACQVKLLSVVEVAATLTQDGFHLPR